MPKYRSLDTAVYLAVSDLATTTTIDPVKRKGPEARTRTDRIEAAITHRQYLRENLAEVAGNHGTIHFLGTERMPFLAVETRFEEYKPSIASQSQVQMALARSGLPLAPEFNASGETDDEHSPLSSLGSTPTKEEESPAEKRQSSPALPPVRKVESDRSAPCASPPSNTPIPQALFICVDLSSKAFFKASVGNRPTYYDVKIDVFFNGSLAHSTFVPSRHRNAEGKEGEFWLNPTFTGQRTQILIERPWVIVPPGQNPDGSPRDPDTLAAHEMQGPEKRWSAIAAQLMHEADLEGFSKHGDRSPVGDFLATLANLPTPSVIGSLQAPGGLQYGVVDVVLSLGKGRKYGPSTTYLVGPKRMVDQKYRYTSPPLAGTFHDDSEPEEMIPDRSLAEPEVYGTKSGRWIRGATSRAATVESVTSTTVLDPGSPVGIFSGNSNMPHLRQYVQAAMAQNETSTESLQQHLQQKMGSLELFDQPVLVPRYAPLSGLTYDQQHRPLYSSSPAQARVLFNSTAFPLLDPMRLQQTPAQLHQPAGGSFAPSDPAPTNIHIPNSGTFPGIHSTPPYMVSPQLPVTPYTALGPGSDVRQTKQTPFHQFQDFERFLPEFLPTAAPFASMLPPVSNSLSTPFGSRIVRAAMTLSMPNTRRPSLALDTDIRKRGGPSRSPIRADPDKKRRISLNVTPNGTAHVSDYGGSYPISPRGMSPRGTFTSVARPARAGGLLATPHTGNSMARGFSTANFDVKAKLGVPNVVMINNIVFQIGQRLVCRNFSRPRHLVLRVETNPTALSTPVFRVPATPMPSSSPLITRNISDLGPRRRPPPATFFGASEDENDKDFDPSSLRLNKKRRVYHGRSKPVSTQRTPREPVERVPPPVPSVLPSIHTPKPSARTTPLETPASSPEPSSPVVDEKKSRKERKKMKAEDYADVAGFVVPPLSQDCVITFSQPQPDGKMAGGGGVVRQVKSERAGEFEQNSVLMGVRFLVGA